MVIDIHYWVKVLKKIFITGFTVLIIYLGFRLSFFYLPFLIAFVISLLLEPGIKRLMKNGHLTRKKSAILLLVLVVLIIGSIIAFASSTIVSESSNLLGNLNYYVEITIEKIQDLRAMIQNWNVSEEILEGIEGALTEFITTISDAVKNILKGGVNLFTAIPTIAVYFMITVLALYFLCTDKVYMIDQLEHHLPESWVKQIYHHTKEITKSLGNYLKAEAILVLISFSLIAVGLTIFHWIGFQVKYPLLYALGIGFVDALPIFGSGTVMIPWAIFKASTGDIKLGSCILLLWGMITVVRQILEPKIVGKHIGIHPIFTLIAMYTGFKTIGLFGLFIGPIVLIILKSIFSTMIEHGLIKTIFSREIE